ncbi:MAG: hypothetical protein GX557_07125 [Chloroflexi bacterium]|nr:hypothetical protein [Chloroflexota bacterium]
MSSHCAAPWYHGSPQIFAELACGSTITQDRHLAEVFAHKPTLVSLGGRGRVRHNGRAAGLLYRVAEPVGPDDVIAHPHSTMPAGLEWLTTRPLKVELLGPVPPTLNERMSPLAEHLLVLRARAQRRLDRLIRRCRGWSKRAVAGVGVRGRGSRRG